MGQRGCVTSFKTNKNIPNDARWAVETYLRHRAQSNLGIAGCDRDRDDIPLHSVSSVLNVTVSVAKSKEAFPDTRA